ncbi:HD-GYP domain-containing protein [Devosia sp. RR2S18]|uniref:HD-GYP domain-containing protein n=1 Tax=Devosia rhizosphaerae TaxID=3049774 RepID=UPI00253FB6EB|nr:HD-GYP domain-containing protein [Devosia sp. RR2S18]WIJ25944.1 HD-GYP domain-containing protein [Devosia sp. RR2S18]
MPVKPPDQVHLSELLGAMSYALDLTEGQPVGHSVRATWIGLQLGRALDLSERELWELYYTVMLKDLGCSSNAARICELYLSDDLSFKRDFKTMGDSLPQVLSFVFSHTGLGAGLAERLRATFNILKNGGVIVDDLIRTRCHRGAAIAAHLRFPVGVSDGIHALDEHWDGKGRPDQLAGLQIPIYARIALLAQVVDVFHTSSGPEATLAEVQQRSGTWFDPDVVRVFQGLATDTFWKDLAAPGLEQRLIEQEPPHSQPIDDDYLDDIARAFAQIVDSKSPFTSGHSERVAVYADLIAGEYGLSLERRRWLQRGALLHDIGKLGVSNSILDKNGKLAESEWQEVRRHPELSEEILRRVPVFKDLAHIGGGHHERLDGRGYPRGLAGADIPLETRIVSVADVFDALTADRPYRAAMTSGAALDIMRADLDTAFDPACLAALERALAKLEDGEATADPFERLAS